MTQTNQPPHMIEALQTLRDPNARILEFYHPSFTLDEVRQVAAALPSSHIVKLHLKFAEKPDECIAAIAEVLPQTKICTLLVPYNKMTNRGASALAKALPKSHVSTIMLNGNKMDEGIKEGLTKRVSEKDARALKFSNQLRRDAKIPTKAMWKEICGMVPLISYKMHNDARMMKIAQSAFDAGYDCSSFLCQAFPLATALPWLEERGITMKASDFLNKDGTVPTDRYLCYGGVAALFKRIDMWENADQVRTAYRSLPDIQKPSIENYHALFASLRQSEARMEQRSRRA